MMINLSPELFCSQTVMIYDESFGPLHAPLDKTIFPKEVQASTPALYTSTSGRLWFEFMGMTIIPSAERLGIAISEH
jgi:hypothetical protein